MTALDPAGKAAPAAETRQATGPRSWRSRCGLALKIVQVRLRFILVLGAAFLIVGQWPTLRYAFDQAADWLTAAPPASQGVTGDTEFFCPMDPGVVSNWPTICPICNMDLVRRKRGTGDMLPEGVVARMQLSPYRIQLAGIQTSPVGFRRLVREIRLAGQLQRAADSDGEGLQSAAPHRAPPATFVLDAQISERDLRFLTVGRPVDVNVAAFPEGPSFVAEVAPRPAGATDSGLPVARLRIADERGVLQSGMFARAVVSIPLAEEEPYRSVAPRAAAGELLAVPDSAVVDTGSRKVVYVETMPGMFDGVEVFLGPRCGDDYPVLRGLEAGWKVATVGAFLIDAETRLNPSLAAGYFGAAHGRVAPATGAPPAPANSSGRSPATSPATPPAAASLSEPRRKPAAPSLSPADAKLAAQQKTCPVTGLALDAMGGPVAVAVGGRKVFLCCRGCEAKLLKDPAKYLQSQSQP